MRRPLTFAGLMAAGILMTHVSMAKDAALLSLGAEHFTATAAVVEDSQTTTISSEPGYVQHRGLMGSAWHDEFLKAVIDRGTNHKTFEIAISLTYSGARRLYKDVRYSGLPETASLPVMLLKTQSVNCALGDCIYTDHLAIPVDESLLRHIAQQYIPGHATLWTFRVLAKQGPGYEGSLSTAEVAGFLAKVDAYIQNPIPAPTVAAVPPTRLEFGITGMAVAPAPDMPNRRGVLVVSVAPGSVAQKAGIITGDIIYQFDTRSIHALADLEAAVATSAAHSVARIGLFRGTEATALEARF